MNKFLLLDTIINPIYKLKIETLSRGGNGSAGTGMLQFGAEN